MNPLEAPAAIVMGYILQWARAPKAIPSWASYAGLVVATAAVWYWMNPDAAEQLRSNWRTALASILMFGLAARGTASIASGVGAAPKTDSI